MSPSEPTPCLRILLIPFFVSGVTEVQVQKLQWTSAYAPSIMLLEVAKKSPRPQYNPLFPRGWLLVLAHGWWLSRRSAQARASNRALAPEGAQFDIT